MPTDLAALAQRLVDCAAAAQAEKDGHPPTASVLREYRKDARAVTAAVLQGILSARKANVEVALDLPGVGRVPLHELIMAVERVEAP